PRRQGRGARLSSKIFPDRYPSSSACRATCYATDPTCGFAIKWFGSLIEIPLFNFSNLLIFDSVKVSRQPGQLTLRPAIRLTSDRYGLYSSSVIISSALRRFTPLQDACDGVIKISKIVDLFWRSVNPQLSSTLRRHEQAAAAPSIRKSWPSSTMASLGHFS